MRVDPNELRASASARVSRKAAVIAVAALGLLTSACSGASSGASSSTGSPEEPVSASAVTSSSPTAAGLGFSMKDAKGGYVIHFPASWNEHQDLAGISLIAPQHVGLAGFHYKGTNENLQQTAKHAPDIEKTQVSNFRLIDTSPATIDGEKAVQFTYTGQNQSKVDLKAFATWTVRGGRAYRFSFTASANYYDQLYPTAQAVMHSIHFT